MDLYGIAILIAVISATIGAFMFFIKKSDYKRNNAKKYKIHICNISFVVGLLIYISFLICSCNGKHYDSTIKYEEYPIEKVTFNNVYFNGRDGDGFNESWVILENPNNEHQNVVVVETEYYTLNWLFKIKTSSSKYHVYLSEETFERFQDGNVIYKCE